MPNMDVIQQLKLEGHTMDIEGCSLPPADEEVFQFECKNAVMKMVLVEGNEDEFLYAYE